MEERLILLVKEAYTIYANEVRAHLAKVGAEPIFAGEVQRLILGDVEGAMGCCCSCSLSKQKSHVSNGNK